MTASEPEHLRTYPVDPSQEISRDFSVTVEDKAVPVLSVSVPPADPIKRYRAVDQFELENPRDEKASLASFDMDSPVKIVVQCSSAVRSVKVLPASLGIAPTIEGQQIVFALDRPRQLTVEVNGDWCHSLHLLASPFETAVPDPHDPNVIYFGPGVHRLKSTLRVGSGQTLYLAAGAVLRGMAKPDDSPMILLEGDHISLRGRGMIDGGDCPIHTHNLVIVRGQNISLEGVTLCDAPTWNVPVRRSDHVTIDNLKIFGCRANSDGIDVCNSRDVTITNCFLRTLDDLIVVKTDLGQGPVQHVVARGCVLWNSVAHALSLGAELREPVDDVVFADCDVIHDIGREWALRVYLCDHARISNVRFENIRIEESARPISLWINKANWSLTADRGHIAHVEFKDITGSAAVPLRVELEGFDAEHRIEDVRFDHVRFNGQPLRREDVRTNAFVEGVTVVP